MLTAYHCTYHKDTGKPCDHSDGKTLAYFGAHRFTKKDRNKTFSIPIIDVKFPPFAEVNKSDSNTHDLAIRVLKSPLFFSSKIRPICLPDPGEEFYGESVMAAGWGKTHKNSKQSSVLKAVKLTVSKKRYNHTKLIGTELSKNKGGEYQDPCTGDSGIRIFNLIWLGGGLLMIFLLRGGSQNSKFSQFQIFPN